MHVDCSYVAVPEDRSTRDGNVIRLAVVRLRGSVPSAHPDPVIYLAGGPGESTLQRMYGHIDDARLIWKERDLILVDQRGVGHSEPRLECPHYHRRKAELGELELDPAEALRQEVGRPAGVQAHPVGAGHRRQRVHARSGRGGRRRCCTSDGL